MIFALFCVAALVVNGQAQGSGRRIIEGDKATEGQFPYVGLLYYGDEAYCGASIIHKRWALTAAHCIQTEKPDPKILVGTVKTYGDTYYHAEKLIRHGAYVSLSEKENNGLEFVINDIGLVRLAIDIQYNYQTVADIPIATKIESYDNQIGLIVGWGKDRWVEPSFPDTLMFGKVRIMTQEECRFFYPYVADHHICTAVDGTQSLCNGDSGGPLVLHGLVIGIASTADYDCRFGGRPNLYTKVTSFISWIQDQLSSYGDEL